MFGFMRALSSWNLEGKRALPSRSLFGTGLIVSLFLLLGGALEVDAGPVGAVKGPFPLGLLIADITHATNGGWLVGGAIAVEN